MLYETTVDLTRGTLTISDLGSVMEDLRGQASPTLRFDADKLPKAIHVEFVVGPGGVEDLWELHEVCDGLNVNLSEYGLRLERPTPVAEAVA